jgi:GNAT superfamily N-acetyltransferase
MSDTACLIRSYRDEDLEALVEANNAYYDDMPTTPEQRRHERSVRPKEFEAAEYVGEVDGRPVVFGIYVKAVWLREPGRGWLHYMMHPDFAGHPVEAKLFARLLEHSMRLGDAKMTATMADKHPHHVKTVLDAGFKIDQRQPVTAVELSGFDAGPFQPTTERLATEGISLRALKDVAADRPGWKEELYRLHCEVWQDVPMQETPKPMPWTHFSEMLDDPKRYALPGKYVAMEGDAMVGLSEIQRNPADPRLGQTMLTGVSRTHRRRGIASALKATALEWAKAEGMERVTTDNEENNPMLDLNKALGFKEVYAWLVCSKAVA